MTAEAAVGMAALLMLAMLLMQSLVVATTYVRMLSVETEALRIATASGPPETQIAAAEEFVRQAVADSRVSHTTDGETVTLVVQHRVHVLGGRWQPELTTSMTGRLLSASGSL